jgi:ribosomal protein L37AE/L43A
MTDPARAGGSAVMEEPFHTRATTLERAQPITDDQRRLAHAYIERAAPDDAPLLLLMLGIVDDPEPTKKKKKPVKTNLPPHNRDKTCCPKCGGEYRQISKDPAHSIRRCQPCVNAYNRAAYRARRSALNSPDPKCRDGL